MTIIAVICPGPPERTPSTYYRFGQYKDLWREQGAELIFVPKQELKGNAKKILEKADVIVNQKCLLPSHFFKTIRSLDKPLFFDLDDLIWHRAKKDYSFLTKLKIGRRLSVWTRGVDRVLCANSFIASGILERTGIAPSVVPMSLDVSEWLPDADKNSRLADRLVRVGWTGSPEYHWLLKKIEPAILMALDQCENLEFSIHSGVDPGLRFPYRFVAWEKGNEANYVKSLDIGLLPMDSSSQFSLGKSPIKGLQYLSSSVVPLGNFCGASLDYLNSSNSMPVLDDSPHWADAIAVMAKDSQRRVALQSQGVEYLRRYHDHRIVGKNFLEMLLGCPAGST
uniref:hypothetical protein n=1 Tax=Cyanobium sp. TaxID=2164130 RepID=UPI004048D1C3